MHEIKPSQLSGASTVGGGEQLAVSDATWNDDSELL